MWYELLDSETRNCVGVYLTDTAALCDVYRDVRRYGSTSREILNLGLLAIDSDGDSSHLIARGTALATLAVDRCSGPAALLVKQGQG